jgi:hypothetical protein
MAQRNNFILNLSEDAGRRSQPAEMLAMIWGGFFRHHPAYFAAA